MVRPNRLLAVFLVTSLATASCTPQQFFSPRLSSDVSGQATPAVPASAGPSITTEEGWALVQQSFLLVLEYHVELVDPVVLLDSAWQGFANALPAGVPRPNKPSLTGTNAQADLLRMRLAYLTVASNAGGSRDLQSNLAHGAIRQMLSDIGDCHTAFASPQSVREMAARLQGDARFGGVGIRIKRQPRESIIVWELLEGGSAGKAGVKPGDAIIKVDGRALTPDLSVEQVASLIRGPEGSSVKLTVQHADNRQQDVSVKRVRLNEPVFAGKLLPSNVAYLRLINFTETSKRELLASIQQAEAKNPKGWIIDLRTNSGGDLQVLLSLLSKFLKDGPFGFEVNRQGQQVALGPDGSYLPRQRPLVVLVSDTTSSAAELFAAALQHYNAAMVVGTRTQGCTGLTARYLLPDESAVSVTTSKLLGPGGEDLNKVGITPKTVVEVTRADLAAGRDPQMDRALAMLNAR